MPTYDYLCEKCKKTFEVYQSMKDPVLATCPKELCRQKTWGRGKIKRQLGTGAGLIFKGSGFYITDYRSEGYKASAKSETSAASGGEKKTGEAKAGETKATETKKTESQPAAASAEKPKPAAAKKKKTD